MVDFQKPYFVDPTIQYPAEEKMLSSPNDVPGDHLLKNRSKQAPIRTFGDIIKALNLLGFNHRTSTGGSGGGGPQGEVGPAGGVLVEDYVADLNSGTYPTGSSVQVLDYSADVSGGGGLFNVYDELPNGWTAADNKWFCYSTANGKYAVRQVNGVIDVREFGILPVDIYDDGFDLTNPAGWVLEDTQARNLFTEDDIGKTVYIKDARTDGATHGRATVAGISDANTLTLTNVSLQQVASDTEIRIGTQYLTPDIEPQRRWAWYNKEAFVWNWPAGEYFADFDSCSSQYPSAPDVTVQAKGVTIVGTYRWHGHCGVTNVGPFGPGFGENVGFFFHLGHSIETLEPYVKTVTFKVAGRAANYRIGDRVMISAANHFGYGFPPDMQYTHFDVVDKVDVGANTITLRFGGNDKYEALEDGNNYTESPRPGDVMYGYFDPSQPGVQVNFPAEDIKYTDIGVEHSPRGGPAHCLNLDRRNEGGIEGNDQIWNGRVRIEGLKLENEWDLVDRVPVINMSEIEEIELFNVDFPAVSTTMCRSFRAWASHLGDLQTDKLIGSVYLDGDCQVNQATHSTGVQFWRMNGGHYYGQFPGARRWLMENVTAQFTGATTNGRLQTGRIKDSRVVVPTVGPSTVFGFTPELSTVLDRETGVKLRVQAIINGYNQLLLVPSDGGMANYAITQWSAGTYDYTDFVFYSGVYYRCNSVTTTGEPGVSPDWVEFPVPLNFVVYYGGSYYVAITDDPATLPSDPGDWTALTVSGQSGYQSTLVGVKAGARCCRIDDTVASFLVPPIDNEGVVQRVQFQDVMGGALWVDVSTPEQFQVGDKIMFLAADVHAENVTVVPGGRNPAQVGSNTQAGMPLAKVGDFGDSYVFKSRIGPYGLSNVDSSGVVSAWPNVDASVGSGALLNFFARGFLKKVTFNVIKAYGGATGTVTATPQVLAGYTKLGDTINLKVAGARVLENGAWTGAQSGDTLTTVVADGTYIWGPSLSITQLTSEDVDDLPVIEITYELYKKKPSL